MEKKKQGFFSKIKQAIFKFENYIQFATEKTTVAIGYFFKLIIIFSFILSIAFTYKFVIIIQNSIGYMREELPNFQYKNGELKFETNEPIILEDDKNAYAIIINTVEDSIEDISYEAGILFLKDKVKIKTPPSAESITYSYHDIENQYGIKEFSKQDVIQYLDGSNLTRIYAILFVITWIYMFIIYAVLIFLDILMLAIFGFIITGISRIRLKFTPVFNMSIYAMTLSIILNAIYIVVNLLTGFTINYFQLMYNAIAYIYLITAILMIKSDLMKQQLQLMRIIEEQKKVKEEEEKEPEFPEKDKNPKKNPKKEEKPNDNPTPEGT